MSYKKSQHLDYLEDVESDFYSDDDEDIDSEQNTEKIADDIRDAMFEFVKNCSVPMCEFLSQKAMEAFIEHTMKIYTK